MKIEILPPSKMVRTGSSLLRDIMNEHTPVLDLLVRESIQNSLDAALDDGKDKPVSVMFQTGLFEPALLNKNLEGITDELNKRFQDIQYKFLSISDKGTKGLTGTTDSGNLAHLVYHANRPQDKEGAGGSWGIGKTIYFRIGIGLVFYYSRIFDTGTNKYESRLAGCFVEDEKSDNPIIPLYNNKKRLGIAWWGNQIAENSTQPVTDEKYIDDFLRIFNISPYNNEETGTKIIIPYIDEEALLNNNAIEYKNNLDNTEIIPYWRMSLKEYFGVSVQRWYFPRLENRSYKNGKWLEVYINDQQLVYDDMLPLFKLYQSLYNRAAGGVPHENDFIKTEDLDIIIEDIKVRSVSDISGRVAFQKFSKKAIGLCPPYNDYHPNINLELEMTEGGGNCPILAYCRKPGMIVSYVQDGPWLRNVPRCDTDEFIIAVFVLNSGAIGQEIGNLEEYVRKGEPADHTKWEDSAVNNKNINLIARIRKKTANTISGQFQETDDDGTKRQISGLGRLLGKIILPSVGFGSAPTSRIRTNGGGARRIKEKLASYELTEIKYYKTKIIALKYSISTTTRMKSMEVLLEISSLSSSISMESWENELFMDCPFEISSTILKITEIEGKEKRGLSCAVHKDEGPVKIGELSEVDLKYTSRGTAYGVTFNMLSQLECTMELIVCLTLNNCEVCPEYVVNINKDR